MGVGVGKEHEGTSHQPAASLLSQTLGPTAVLAPVMIVCTMEENWVSTAFWMALSMKGCEAEGGGRAAEERHSKDGSHKVQRVRPSP